MRSGPLALLPMLCAASSNGGLLRHMLTAPKAVVLLDANNLRGAACFQQSYTQVSDAAARWAEENELAVISAFDHGSHQRAWRTGPWSASVLAGSAGESADDIIVRDCWWLRSQHARHVFIFTSDAGLAARAQLRRAGPVGSVEVLPSALFASLMNLGGNDDANAADDEVSPLPRRATRKESTADRIAAGRGLEASLHERHMAAPADPSPSSDALGSLLTQPSQVKSSQVESSQALDTLALLANYVVCINEPSAVKGSRRQAELLWPESPSSKRRLRRKRAASK